MKSPEFIGVNIDAETKEAAHTALKKWEEMGLEPLEREEEKTIKEQHFISTANEILSAELERLGIKEFVPIEPERVHLLDSDGWKQHFGRNKQGAGATEALHHRSLINIDKTGRSSSDEFFTILHEMLHMASFRKFAIEHIDEERSNISEYRLGYDMHNPFSEESQLQAFNEAMTAFTTFVFARNHLDTLKKRGIEIDLQDPEKRPHLGYERLLPLVNRIIEGISHKEGEDYLVSANRLIKGIFAGELMHLRRIEQAFGEGSLKKLSAVSTRTSEEKLEELMTEFS